VSEHLPAGPFADWIEHHARARGSLLALEEACGVAPDSLRHVLRFRRPVALDLVDRCVTAVGLDTIWTLYPDHEPAGRVRGGRRTGVPRKLTDEQIRAAHRLHIDGGLSIRELGRRLYERYGYSSPQSLANCLCAAFDLLGLDARDRIQAVRAVSTVHGKATREHRDRAHTRAGRVRRGEILDRPRCAAVRTQHPRKGQPCGNRALADSDYCWGHDPRYEQQRQAILEDARRRRYEAAA
jgi:hypothetical protein